MTPYYQDESVTLWHGDALAVLRGLPDGSVDSCVTSPPYFGLRDYGVEGQMGAESSPAEYVENMRAVFEQVRRVLAADGTLWLNLGDSYASGPIGPQNGACGKTATDGIRTRADKVLSARKVSNGGLPPKSLLGIPWRAAFALQDDGWTLRNSVIWHKPNAMPESVTDRLSTRHENVFLLTKSRRYWFDLDAVREDRARSDRSDVVGTQGKYAAQSVRLAGGNAQSVFMTGEYVSSGKNPGDVWSIPTSPFPGAHFATMPLVLAERCVQAGCKPGGTVLDPFSGSGTTGLAAARHGRRYVGIDLNEDYLKLSLETRLQQATLNLGGAAS